MSAGAGSRAGASVRVRAARREDLAAIWALLHGLARYERLETYLTGSAERLGAHVFGDAWPKVECLVAERDGALDGYALFFGTFSSFRTAPLLWLEDLYVRDEARGTSVGRRLLAAVARVAVGRGCPRIDWAVLDWNDPAIEFYERLGARRSLGWHGYQLEGEALRALSVRGD